MNRQPPARPTLYVIATPIGNLGDITQRALEVLRTVDALACEDTRVTRKILDRYEIPRPPLMFAHHAYNEESSVAGVLKLLREGKHVGLCSDAGTPGVSDPGYRVIAAAVAAGMAVEVVPGPSAAIAALVVSGLPTSSYTFLGFLPPKGGARRRSLDREAASRHTLILYESPRRLGALLADALSILGDRRAVVAIELTKLFESVERGWLRDLTRRFADHAVKGEVTVVIAGQNPKFSRREEPVTSGEPSDALPLESQ